MTPEEKDLLLKELHSKWPHGVKILHKGWNYEWDDELSTIERVVGIDEDFIYTKVIDVHNGEEYRDDKRLIDTFDDKLFLRPMSSITEEEISDLRKINSQFWFDKFGNFAYVGAADDGFCSVEEMGNILNYLDSKYLDYRGLIEKSLAIKVTEENNPYNIT